MGLLRPFVEYFPQVECEHSREGNPYFQAFFEGRQRKYLSIQNFHSVVQFHLTLAQSPQRLDTPHPARLANHHELLLH